jgi:hypothetical protein
MKNTGICTVSTGSVTAMKQLPLRNIDVDFHVEESQMDLSSIMFRDRCKEVAAAAELPVRQNVYGEENVTDMAQSIQVLVPEEFQPISTFRT